MWAAVKAKRNPGRSPDVPAEARLSTSRRWNREPLIWVTRTRWAEPALAGISVYEDEKGRPAPHT
jgi:hypothetical protein